MLKPVLSEIAVHFPVRDGVCRPEWSAIARWVESALPEAERSDAWVAAEREWMQRLRDGLGGSYRVAETGHFLILAAASESAIRELGRSFESLRRQIAGCLEGIAAEAGWGKQAVLVFASLDDYYAHIAWHYPDGEHPQSSGVLLTEPDFQHHALPATDWLSYRTVLVHELTHGLLSHLPLPAWMNEAVAMRMEEVICGTPVFQLDRESCARHAAHWNADTIQQFWSGASWRIPGESFELSYGLAQILWRKLEVDLRADRGTIMAFLCDAVPEDAGEAACRRLFGLGLGDLAEDFLGDGSWAPDPAAWRAD